MEFEPIPDERAEKLRERFIAAFIDTSSEYYRKYYEKSEYGGRFLWECLNAGGEVVTQEQAAEFLERFDRLYFMWDFWREGTVFADEYPNAVIEASGGELGRLAVSEWNAEIEAEKHDCYIEHPQLPSDVYIFDDSFSWCVVFTHESNDCDDLDDIIRYCIKFSEHNVDKKG